MALVPFVFLPPSCWLISSFFSDSSALYSQELSALPQLPASSLGQGRWRFCALNERFLG